MSLGTFFSWDQLFDYVENTMNIKYIENPTGWLDAVKELTANSKSVKIVNDTTGATTQQWINKDMFSGVGEMHVGENYSSGSQTVTGGGGVKSAPTAKSVITNSSTQTAVITEEAVGVKDVGVVQSSKAKGVLGGLLMMYGIVSEGIKIANSKVWKDMCNAVFNTEFTEATPLETIRNFLNTKISVFTSVENGELVTKIPDSIATNMYNFLANHMVSDGQPTVEVDFTGLSFIYRWIDRGYVSRDPNLYTFERYLSTSNPDDNFAARISRASDDMFKIFAQDYITMLMGAGYTVPTNVGDALVYSCNGICQNINTAWLAQGIVRDIAEADVVVVIFNELLGRTNIPKTVPIALSEISFIVWAYFDTGAIPSDVSSMSQVCNFHTYNNAISSFLGSGESMTYGDCIKYKKRNETGISDEDYAYQFKLPASYSCTRTMARVTYPSNEFTISDCSSLLNSIGSIRTNGHIANDIYKTMPLKFYDVYYSNLGVKGDGTNYTPDDYLVAAGFRKNKTDKNPDPNKTKEQLYPAQENKTQLANPQADNSTGQITNSITDYTPSTVIFGDDAGDRSLDHGINNTNDPESYIDNRSQEDKEEGKVNTNDPIDGFNEDTQDAIDDYNDSRTDPEHYPDPIPENEPNPQYPTDPPSDTEGDTGETPEPAVMEGVEASGMASIYNPTKAQIINFSAWLWSPNFFDNFLKIFANPMDAIIGLHILYATPSTTTPSNIIVGYLDSGVSAKVVDKQFTEIDCGTVGIPEYYGNAIDYEPYTQIHCYLPFIGIVSLKPNDVLGKQLNIKYGIDVLTGTCLAILTSKLGNSEIACYNFSGNCAVQVPLSGGNYAQMITGLAGFLAGGIGAVATANPIMALGAGASLLNTHLDVAHSGSIGSNAGAMGVRKPYLIITRKSIYNAANYNDFYGYPANKTVQLNSCKGYTRIKSLHIDSISRATDSEKTEIETLLKQGVIIK